MLVRRHWDGQHVQGRCFNAFTALLLATMRHAGFAPKIAKHQPHPSYLEVSVAVRGRRERWALPSQGQRWKHDLAKDFPRLGAETVLVRRWNESEQRRASRYGKRLVSLFRLLTLVHEAEIVKIEEELGRPRR